MAKESGGFGKTDGVVRTAVRKGVPWMTGGVSKEGFLPVFRQARVLVVLGSRGA